MRKARLDLKKKEWFDNHPEFMAIKREKNRIRFNNVSIEKRNERNKRRRERRWNGKQGFSHIDTPTNKVYIHTFPNGKIYVGITKNTELRWDDGEGYATNPAMYDDIKKFGWDNISHEVVAEGLFRDSALSLETQLIFMYDATNPLKGYNRKCCSKVV